MGTGTGLVARGRCCSTPGARVGPVCMGLGHAMLTPCSLHVHSMLTSHLLVARRDSFWLQCAMLYYYLWKRCSSQLPKYHVCMRLVKIKRAKTEALARVKFREQILGIYSLWSG